LQRFLQCMSSFHVIRQHAHDYGSIHQASLGWKRCVEQGINLQGTRNVSNSTAAGGVVRALVGALLLQQSSAACYLSCSAVFPRPGRSNCAVLALPVRHCVPRRIQNP
jgi:hypothetical protein